MNVLLLANEEQKEELLSCTVGRCDPAKVDKNAGRYSNHRTN